MLENSQTTWIYAQNNSQHRRSRSERITLQLHDPVSTSFIKMVCPQKHQDQGCPRTLTASLKALMDSRFWLVAAVSFNASSVCIWTCTRKTQFYEQWDAQILKKGLCLILHSTVILFMIWLLDSAYSAHCVYTYATCGLSPAEQEPCHIKHIHNI